MLAVALSRERAAAGGVDGSLTMWDLARREVAWSVRAHTAPVIAVAFVDGLLLSAGADGHVALWDPVEDKRRGDLDGRIGAAQLDPTYLRYRAAVWPNEDPRREAAEYESLADWAAERGLFEEEKDALARVLRVFPASPGGGGFDLGDRAARRVERLQALGARHTAAFAASPDGRMLAISLPAGPVLWDARRVARREALRAALPGAQDEDPGGAPGVRCT